MTPNLPVRPPAADFPPARYRTERVADKRAQFHVITMISNPAEFYRRYELYKQFEDRMLNDYSVQLWTCEIALGERAFAVTDARNPRHLQLRTNDEFWHKENALNLMVARLPADWQTVAWIDADIKFLNANWVDDTLAALDVYEVVQLWENANDLGPRGETIHTHKSAMSSYIQGIDYEGGYASKGKWHPGYAWAMTRTAWNNLGGLIDRSPVGSADFIMCHALVGKYERTMRGGTYPQAYMDYCKAWQGRAERYVKRDVGFVPGTIVHFWHGDKVNRKYYPKHKVIIDNNFHPFLDIFTDWQGLYRIEDHAIGLRDDIRRYFRERDEDSTTRISNMG